MGSFDTFASYAPFFVAGSLLVYETRPFARRIDGTLKTEPLKIRAVSMSNGFEQWNLPVRDTEYHGPYPP